MNDKKKEYLKNERAFWNQVLLQKSHQRDKHMGSLPCKIIGIILTVDKGSTQTNGLKDKKVDDDT